jgi:hypothetical protein
MLLKKELSPMTRREKVALFFKVKRLTDKNDLEGAKNVIETARFEHKRASKEDIL